MDRLGRSLADLVRIISECEQRKIQFESLTEGIETRSPAGRLVFHVFAALAEFERNLIRERTLAGLRAARARGRKGGRPAKLGPKDLKTVRLSPLVFDHINLLGRYAFSVPESIIRGELRPLRRPEDALEDVA